ncbi:MAG: hypothetical protein ACRDTP_00195 [Mycobacteriales bacterium]
MGAERIRGRRTVLSGPPLLSLVLVLVGLLVLRGSVVFGTIWLAVFGSFFLFALVESLVPASVVLAPAGVQARTLAGRRTYSWADCHDFHVWTEGRRSVVVFGYRGRARGALSDADARRAQADRALPPLAGVSADVLLARIEDYARRLTAPEPPPARSAGPSERPTPRPRPRPSRSARKPQSAAFDESLPIGMQQSRE